ncbi:MAG: hypothetical protein NC102_04650 [Clostridium sp.]|nr:hypothetical protein [Clostridium sp.]
MRKSYINALLIPSVAIAMASCDDNSWNDHELDGFESDPAITDVQTIEYTLTAADYAAIASNSDNLSLAGEAGAEALEGVGTQLYFTQDASAAEYVPAFLASSSFPYFTLSDGSAVKVTYKEAVALPEEVAKLAAASKVTISTENYQAAWGSEDDYVDCFTPAVAASKYIPRYIPEYLPDAEAGDYAIVTYQTSDQEPVFGTPDDNGPKFTHTLLGEMADGKYLIVANGNAATVVSKAYGYFGLTEVTVEGENLTAEDVTDIEFTFTATDGGYYIKDPKDRYVYMDETHDSFNFSADLPADAAVWTVTFNEDGSVKIMNVARQKYIQYDTKYSSYGSYNSERGVMPSLYRQIEAAAKAPAKAPLANVPYTTAYSVWAYDGSAWSAAADVVILQPSDYKDMQQSYQNLSGSLPAEYLPIFMDKNYPYAQADDVKYVLYQYYNGSSTSYVADQYVYDGSAWKLNNGIETVTSQFVLNGGVWKFDPSVTVTLPVGKSIPISQTYYQACVDWVYENIDKPLGSTSIKSGLYYVTSYGNNEYYSGTSAYQNNVDLRADKAIEQYPKGYEGMSNDEIVELMKHRFAYEVMPGALKALHADAVPVEGVEVLYTIHFSVYTGSNTEYTIVYKVTAPATFEFVSCDWWENGAPAE